MFKLWRISGIYSKQPHLQYDICQVNKLWSWDYTELHNQQTLDKMLVTTIYSLILCEKNTAYSALRDSNSHNLSKPLSEELIPLAGDKRFRVNAVIELSKYVSQYCFVILIYISGISIGHLLNLSHLPTNLLKDKVII